MERDFVREVNFSDRVRMQNICLRLKVITLLYFQLISHLLSISNLLIAAAIGQYSLLGITSKGDNYPFELTFQQTLKKVLYLISHSKMVRIASSLQAAFPAAVESNRVKRHALLAKQGIMTSTLWKEYK